MGDLQLTAELEEPLLTPQGPDTSTPDQHVPLGFIG